MTPIGTFLDGTAIVQHRGLMWLALSDVGHIISTAGTTDSGGGFSGGSIAAGSAFPCRIDPLGGGETTIASRVDERTTHIATVPSEVSVEAIKQIAIDNRGTFEITAVRERTRGLYRVLEVVESD